MSNGSTPMIAKMEIGISRTKEGKFKGHIFHAGQHIVTAAVKTDKTAVNNLCAEAKSIILDEIDDALKPATSRSSPSPSVGVNDASGTKRTDSTTNPVS